MGDYYLRRWQIFISHLLDSISQGTVIDEGKYAANILLWEQLWNNLTNPYPSQVTKDRSSEPRLCLTELFFTLLFLFLH